MFRGPEIVKGDGATGAQGVSTDNIAGMVFGGVVTAGYPTLGVTVSLSQPADADALNLDAAYDATNNVLVRYHIDEFFRLAPQGTLYIMLVAQGTTMAAIVTKTNNYLHKLIIDSGKKVKHTGVVLNPGSGYTPTLVTGLDGDVITAVPLAQALVDDFITQNVFIDNVIIEGREFNGSVSAAKDLRTLASPNVGVAILQDGDVAALSARYAKTASVGAVLGGLAVREVEEDLGSLNGRNNPSQGAVDMPIDTVASGRFLKVAISSGALTSTLSATDIALLKTKGYIFADSYPEYPGVYFSGSPACTLATSDYAFLVSSRVWNKAARIAVKKLTPKINAVVKTSGGKIKPSTVSSWEADVNNSRDGLGTMVVDEHCTDATCFIDPNQAVNVGGIVNVNVGVVRFEYARRIVGTIGFKLA